MTEATPLAYEQITQEDREANRRVAFIDAGKDMASIVAQALSDMPRTEVLVIGDTRIMEEAADMPRLAMLDALLAIEPVRRRDRMGFYHEPRPQPRTDRGRVIRQTFDGLSGNVTHIDTPKPISKRKVRRLRGKGATA